jgi:hypothetical protein
MRQNRAEFPDGVFKAPEAKVSQGTDVVWKEPRHLAELEGFCPIKGAQAGVSLTKT